MNICKHIHAYVGSKRIEGTPPITNDDHVREVLLCTRNVHLPSDEKSKKDKEGLLQMLKEMHHFIMENEGASLKGVKKVIQEQLITLRGQYR